MENNLSGMLCERLCKRITGHFPLTNCICSRLISEGAAAKVFKGKKDQNVFVSPEERVSPTEMYEMQCEGALMHTITDVAFEIPDCVALESDYGWATYDVLDQEEIERFMQEFRGGGRDQYDWNGPESQICRRIFHDWRAGGNALDECRGIVREKILAWKFMEINRVCRIAEMRRKNWKELFKNVPSGELPLLETNDFNFPNSTSRVTYISPFPDIPEKGRICQFENLYFHERTWYFVTPVGDTTSLLECNTNAQRDIEDEKYEKRPFLVRKITQDAMAELISSSSTAKKVVKTPNILIDRFQGGSHGHVIQDSIIPLYHLMSQAGVWGADEPFNIILNDADRLDSTSTLKIPNGPMQHDEWFKSVSPRSQPMYIDEVQELMCGFQNYCVFDHLYTGFDDMNLLGPYLTSPEACMTNVESDIDPRAFDYRSKVLFEFNRDVVPNMIGEEKAASLGNDASDDYLSGNIVVTLVQRRHSRIVVNMDEVKEEIKRTLANVFVGTYEVNVVDPEDFTPASQIQLVRNSTIIVAVEGGVLDTLVYGRKNTIVVAWGRNPSLKMPEGGITALKNGGEPIFVEFWHELAFINWPRRPPEGLGMHIAKIRTPPGKLYIVDVESTLEGVRGGLEKLKRGRLSKVGGRGTVVSGEPMEIEFIGAPPKALYLDGLGVAFDIEGERKILVIGAEQVPTSGGHELKATWGGNWIETVGNSLPFVVNAPNPWHAVSYWHKSNSPPACKTLVGTKEENIDRLRVLLEPLISCFSFRGHATAIVVGDEGGKGLSELGTDFARHTINVAKACSAETFIFGEGRVRNLQRKEEGVKVGILVLIGVSLGELEEKLGDGKGGKLVRIARFGVISSWRENAEGKSERELGLLAEKIGEIARAEEGSWLAGGWGVQVHTLNGHYCGKTSEPTGSFVVGTVGQNLSVEVPTPAERIIYFFESIGHGVHVPEVWRTKLHVQRSELVAQLKVADFQVVHEKNDGKESAVVLVNREENLQVKISSDDLAARECHNLIQLAGSKFFAHPFAHVMGHEGSESTFFSACAMERFDDASPWGEVSVGLGEAASLIRAVAELKRKGIEHRDITKSNVLVVRGMDMEATVRIIDFTWALPVIGAKYDYNRFAFTDGSLQHGVFPHVGAVNDLSATAKLFTDVPGVKECLGKKMFDLEVFRGGDGEQGSNEFISGSLEAIAAILGDCQVAMGVEKKEEADFLNKRALKHAHFCQDAHLAEEGLHIFSFWGASEPIWDELGAHLEYAVDKVVLQRRVEGRDGCERMHRLYGHQKNVDARIIEGKCNFVKGSEAHMVYVVKFNGEGGDERCLKTKQNLRRHAVRVGKDREIPPDCIHASADSCEASRDILMLTGGGEKGWAGEWHLDPSIAVGATGGWSNVEQMLTGLGAVGEYVLYRPCFDNSCGDYDILVRDKHSALLNMAAGLAGRDWSATGRPGSGAINMEWSNDHYQVLIDGKVKLVEVKESGGEGFGDGVGKRWLEGILDRRICEREGDGVVCRPTVEDTVHGMLRNALVENGGVIDERYGDLVVGALGVGNGIKELAKVHLKWIEEMEYEGEEDVGGAKDDMILIREMSEGRWKGGSGVLEKYKKRG